MSGTQFPSLWSLQVIASAKARLCANNQWDVLTKTLSKKKKRMKMMIKHSAEKRNSFALIEALFAMENSSVGHMTEPMNKTVRYYGVSQQVWNMFRKVYPHIKHRFFIKHFFWQLSFKKCSYWCIKVLIWTKNDSKNWQISTVKLLLRTRNHFCSGSEL